VLHRATGPREVTNNVAIRVEHHDTRDRNVREASLTAALPQKVLRSEHRRVGVTGDSAEREIHRLRSRPN